MKPMNQPAVLRQPPRALSSWRPWLCGVSLVVLVTIVYWPTLDNGFVSDDQDYVINNVSLQSLQGLSNIWFKLGIIQQYYPLVHSTFWVEYHVWGLDPLGYHAVNMLLHAVSAMLLWRLLVRLAVPGAWLAAAIFAVHPVEVESVAWVSERKNVLSCALALGSLLAYLRFSPAENSAAMHARVPAERGPWRYYALALGLYLAALLAKSVTASVPAVLLVIYWWKRGRVKWRDVTPLAPFFAVGVALSGLTVWMEKTYVGAQGEKWDISLVERLLIAGRAAWFYAGKLAWPNPLMFFYPRWTIDMHVWWQYLFPATAVALLVGLWLARNGIGRGPLAAALIFGGVLTPALGFFDVFPFKFSFVADHYQYHASIALIALAAAAVAGILARLPKRARGFAPLASAGLLLPLAVVAGLKTHVYSDNLALHEDVLALDPQSWVASNNLGACLMHQERYDQAIVYLRKAIQLIPGDPMPRSNLGWVLLKQRRFDEAAVELTRALECGRKSNERAWTLKLLGTVQTEQARFDEALESFNQAIELQPGADAYLNRGRIHVILGDDFAALRDVDQALKLQPGAAEALLLRASLLGRTGKYDRALADLNALRETFPDNPEVVLQIGTVYQASKQWHKAVATYDDLLKSNPHNAAAYRGRADSYLGLGKQSQAIADYEAVLKIEPQNGEVLNNLAWALATSGEDKLRDGRRAVELAKAACAASWYKRADILSTLAAAYAETGDFESAIAWSVRALGISNEQLKEELTRQLECYRDHKPWREAAPPVAGPI